MQFQNIYTLFREQAAKYKGKPVFYTRAEREWLARSWDEFEAAVHEFASALLAKGLAKGASVAILAGNVPEWTIADIGAIAAGGVGVGIYPTSSREQCEFIIDHSDAEFVVVDSIMQLEKIAEFCERSGKVKEVICLEQAANATSWPEFLQHGRERLSVQMARIEELGFGAAHEDTAIMVYTSGTTGLPKGAMLSHAYVLNSVESLRRSVPIFDTDVSFSYLPGCHVAERISGIYNRLYNGTPAYFVDDLSRLNEYMQEVRPTVFASLPRFFEKIHASIVAAHGAETVDPQVVRDAFGGRIRLLTSGGAPLPQEIARFFADAGVPILQAYGLTENICVAFNTVTDLKFGTVGKPMPMCEVRIAEDGEILVKSPMMFSGYYKQPEKTAEMFTGDGWLLTGDLGEIDADGFLKITGRKKEMIVLSSGKNVAPALIENLVKESHLISHCVVYGDGRSYCVALITINAAEAAGRSDIDAEVAAAVAAANSHVSRSEQIKRYEILPRELSGELGEVTPTHKVKREVVARNFAEILGRLYE